jgi:predicted nucleic acid-binding protein
VVIYLLDTNVAVDYLTGRYPAFAERLRSLVPEEVAISSVAVAELRYGADESERDAAASTGVAGSVEPMNQPEAWLPPSHFMVTSPPG